MPPTTTSPEFTPTRTGRSSPAVAAWRYNPAWQARRAWSSCDTGAPNSAMITVAGEFVDRASEPGDSLRENAEEPVHELGPVLGVRPLRPVHRPGHVGEEDGDLLPLANGAGCRRRRGARRLAGASQWPAALGAEPVAPVRHPAATRARHRQRRPAARCRTGRRRRWAQRSRDSRTPPRDTASRTIGTCS